MNTYTLSLINSSHANPSLHRGSYPIGPGEQARVVELFRIALAAEAQKWRVARRSRQQAGSLTTQSGMRAWRAA